jgi:hypothetical protein
LLLCLTLAYLWTFKSSLNPQNYTQYCVYMTFFHDFPHKEVEAQSGQDSCPSVQVGTSGGRPQNALSASPPGRSRAASAGKLPQGCLQWGWSIPRHFKCTSRRGIWHLNSPYMFFHHLQLVKAHSRPACLRILLCCPRERSRADPPEPQPGAL